MAPGPVMVVVTPPAPEARRLAGPPADVSAHGARPIAEPVRDAHRSRSHCGPVGICRLARISGWAAKSTYGGWNTARTCFTGGPGSAAGRVPWLRKEGCNRIQVDVVGHNPRPAPGFTRTGKELPQASGCSDGKVWAPYEPLIHARRRLQRAS